MTADTSASHRCVINPSYAGPAQGGVAGFTTVVRSNVVRVFTRRDRTVVTTAAIAGDIAVIENRMTPIHGRVAVVALVVTRHVIGCLAFGTNIVVTVFALIGCAGKDRILVTAVALDIAMTAGQGKTGGEMIKSLNCGQGLGTLKSSQHQHEHDEHQTDALGCVRMPFISHRVALHHFCSWALFPSQLSEGQVP
jgi:hypothetical protein